MGLLDQVKDRTNKVVAAGSAQMIDLRDDRRRRSLYCELGELTFRERQGEVVAAEEIDRVVDELKGLDTKGESSEDESSSDD